MTQEQRALLNKARDSVRAARLLASDGLYDFAVSRAFYVAQALLLGEALAFSKHSAVISNFGQRFAKTQRVPAKFHRYLIEAQDKRNVGDYDIGPPLRENDAGEQIARAEEFLVFGEGFLG